MTLGASMLLGDRYRHDPVGGMSGKRLTLMTGRRRGLTGERQTVLAEARRRMGSSLKGLTRPPARGAPGGGDGGSCSIVWRARTRADVSGTPCRLPSACTYIRQATAGVAPGTGRTSRPSTCTEGEPV